jgi:hypothetical protein
MLFTIFNINVYFDSDHKYIVHFKVWIWFILFLYKCVFTTKYRYVVYSEYKYVVYHKV